MERMEPRGAVARRRGRLRCAVRQRPVRRASRRNGAQPRGDPPGVGAARPRSRGVRTPGIADVVDEIVVVWLGGQPHAWPIVYLAAPSRVPTALAHSPALTADLTWNRDPARHLIRVARGVDRDAVFSDLFATVGRD